MKLVVHVDGGARGNPGPAAAAAVLSDAADGRGRRRGDRVPRRRHQQRRGVPRRCCWACAAPRALGADAVEVVNDSELVAKQVNGEYKVKHPDMKPPCTRRRWRRCASFDAWAIRSVPRAQERRRRRAWSTRRSTRRAKSPAQLPDRPDGQRDRLWGSMEGELADVVGDVPDRVAVQREVADVTDA